MNLKAELTDNGVSCSIEGPLSLGLWLRGTVERRTLDAAIGAAIMMCERIEGGCGHQYRLVCFTERLDPNDRADPGYQDMMTIGRGPEEQALHDAMVDAELHRHETVNYSALLASLGDEEK